MEEIIAKIQVLIAESSDFSDIPTNKTLFSTAASLNGLLSLLSGNVIQAESLYRADVRKYTEDGNSVASAEAKAKSEENYKTWRELQLVYEIGNEHIKLIKKFADKLEEERRQDLTL